jgi:hypothetical protein
MYLCTKRYQRNDSPGESEERSADSLPLGHQVIDSEMENSIRVHIHEQNGQCRALTSRKSCSSSDRTMLHS